MRTLKLCGVLVLVGLWHAAVILAAQTISFTITTNAQDTYIQSTLTAKANAELCGKYNLSPTCNASALATAGCVSAPFSSVTKRNLTYQNCTPFTADAAGENALAADCAAKCMISLFSNDKSDSIAQACANFKALSTADQNSVCSLLGLSNGCDICQ